MLNKRHIYLLLAAMAITLVYCNRHSTEEVILAHSGYFLNLHDSVRYVGMETCRSCHGDVHDTYIHTGMGRSFANATPDKSMAEFGEHALVYDHYLNLYYRPLFRDSVMYIQEYRIEDGDTTHFREEKVAYIVGSGQHTNSHMISINGYVYQAPITFYTQRGTWDLAPGYERGANERFARIIQAECMTCHNHYPDMVEGSLNKYEYVPQGIQCERCHGPGEIHVQEMLAGRTVDTSKYIDYTIVNPAHLPIDLQMDVCQRCHLQGVAVLHEGKTFFDFRPGMALSEIMNVFLPRFSNSDERFIMASQADRLRMSPCFTESKAMTCITCHHPHHSVEVTDINHYNVTCQGCHAPRDPGFCSAPMAELEARNHDCVGCHMPKSGSLDIPHVHITDHFISKANVGRVMLEYDQMRDGGAAFLGLELLTKSHASDLEMARGYLALYDQFAGTEEMLDSAGYYILQSADPEPVKYNTMVHYLFIIEAYEAIAAFTERLDLGLIPHQDPWTWYRVGEAYHQLGNRRQSVSFFRKAADGQPYNLEFREKLGLALAQSGEIQEAEEIFNWVLSENPTMSLSLNNLGFMHANRGQFVRARELYLEAIRLDPDYIQPMLNLAALAVHQENFSEARRWLKRALRIRPDHDAARQTLELISG